jgi:prepilin-type N-terminal cleavage/methylation domain-containing protein
MKSRQHTTPEKRGFTLIELRAALAILGIPAALLRPVLPEVPRVTFLRSPLSNW